MTKRAYTSPEIVRVGSVADLTEGLKSPVAEGYGGSGRYYDASKSPKPPKRPKRKTAKRTAKARSKSSTKKTARKSARKSRGKGAKKR